MAPIHPRYRFVCDNNMTIDNMVSQENLKQAETVDGVKWNFGVTKQPPSNNSSHGSTSLREGIKKFFTSQVSSLLQFIDVGVWMLMVNDSNKYSHLLISSKNNPNGTISGKQWEGDITLSELMVFWG